MCSLKTLAIAGSIVGATAFAPASRGMSAPELRSAVPRICTQGSTAVQSISGEGTTTLQRPSRLTETLLRTFKSVDADNSSTMNLDELKMAASFFVFCDEQQSPLSEAMLRRWLSQNWLRPDPSNLRPVFPLRSQRGPEGQKESLRDV